MAGKDSGLNDMPSRRDVLSEVLGLSSVALAGAWARPANAAAAAVPFGACVRADRLIADPTYKAALAGYCKQVVPEGALKWDVLRPARAEYKFEDADTIVTFARERGLAVRGHTLCWYEALPAWTREISNTAEAERELVTHIEKVVSRYKGIIHSWDVVNEPVAEKGKAATDHRPSIWHRYLGENYIRIAFEAARRADPNVELVINDYGIEAATAEDKNKRAAFIGMIKRLKDQGVPIQAVGLQAHLRGEIAVDQAGVSKFVEDVMAMGLKLLITELDVTDDKLPAAITERDAIAAKRVRELLSAVFAVTRPGAVLTWGLTDRYTWVPMWFKRKDGLPNRPLPLDAEFKPKPMLSVIDEFCRAQT
jgi:endo-1,4-beta-xylanase